MANRNNAQYYTVWLTDTEDVVAFGTSDHCAKMLGMEKQVFFSTISAIKRGTNKKYEFYSEPLYLEEYAGEFDDGSTEAGPDDEDEDWED